MYRISFSLLAAAGLLAGNSVATPLAAQTTGCTHCQNCQADQTQGYVSLQQGATTRAVPTAAATRLGPHRGTLRTVGGVQTETLVHAGGLKVYLYGTGGKPLIVGAARGTAVLSVAGNAKRYRFDLFPAEDGALKADVNLSKVAGRQVEVTYQLVGVAGTRGTVDYRDVATVPADKAQAEAVAIARQKVCPVSRKPLGSMGKPVAVDADGQQVFVCCAGCVNAVKADPAKYVKSRPEVKQVAASPADAKLIAVQKTCPVMDEPLGSMGAPIKLLVGDKPLFLCCKGCIKKVQAQPEQYLVAAWGKDAPKPAEKSVAGGGEQVRPGVFKVTAADKPYVAAQKTCPVMDEPLDAMGGPYRVVADGKAFYICCPGCAKKIAAEPKKWLDVLAAQGVTPPTVR